MTCLLHQLLEAHSARMLVCRWLALSMSCRSLLQVVHCRTSVPPSAQSRRDPTRKGTAHSQASTMLPKPRIATSAHAGCNGSCHVTMMKHSLAVEVTWLAKKNTHMLDTS